MNDAILKETRKENEWKVEWRSMNIGLIRQEETNWRYSDDLKGEFWELDDQETQDEAVEALIILKEKKDQERLAFLASLED